MSIQTIATGSVPDDGTGDPLRVAFTKTNDNFTSLDSSISSISANVSSLSSNVSSIASNVSILQHYAYGAFQSDVTQTCAANTAVPLRFEIVDIADGVTLASNSYITFPNAGIYNIQFSVQTKNTSNSSDPLYIWLRQNNVDIAGSTGKINVPGTQAGGSGELIVGWNFFIKTNSVNEHVQIMWFVTDETHTSIAAFPAQSATASSPAIPSTASAVLTVNQVG